LTTIPDSFENYNSSIIVCPECQTMCNDDFAKAIFEPISGIVLGYMLRCTHCRKKSFINMLGKPPLFDLSGRYMFLTGKED
jgi:hypothetical protein